MTVYAVHAWIKIIEGIEPDVHFHGVFPTYASAKAAVEVLKTHRDDFGDLQYPDDFEPQFEINECVIGDMLGLL